MDTMSLILYISCISFNTIFLFTFFQPFQNVDNILSSNAKTGGGLTFSPFRWLQFAQPMTLKACSVFR